jgi:hypothetical protein
METAKSELDRELEHILSGFEGSEEISESLISELSGKGMPAGDLRFLKSQGFKYFRGTGSFFIPLD